MGRHVATALVVLGMLLAGGQALAQVKMGVVNLDRIMRESPTAQRALKKLEQEVAKREQELNKIGDQLRKMQENLEKNVMTMSESDRQKRERDLGDLNRDFQRKQREYREDLNLRRNEEISSVLDRANRAIRQIAEAEKFDVVFQTDQIVWANSRFDITEKVIKALDESRPAK